MVPLPVRVRSSIGRNPDTSANGYEMVTDTCPGAVVADEQLEGVTSIIASVRVRVREGAESAAVARAAVALSSSAMTRTPSRAALERVVCTW
jgi:hypothetical protein